MPRRSREESPTAIYHVTSRGNAGVPIFLDGYDRDWFLTLLARVVERDGWRLFAYCLMDTHFISSYEPSSTRSGEGCSG